MISALNSTGTNILKAKDIFTELEAANRQKIFSIPSDCGPLAFAYICKLTIQKMKDFATAFKKEFWITRWQSLKDRLRPYLAPLLSRYRVFASKHPFWNRVLQVIAAGFLVMSLFLLSILAGVFGHLPSKADLRNLDQNIASEVYSEDGVLLGKYFVENRLPVELDSISPFVIDALISTEDARFFEHNGVDLRAGLRVLFRTILKGDESGGGGSTISQQLAKNLYPRKRLWYLTIPVAKIKEMIIARRLERIYGKKGVLALYLNTVPFGENVFGIKMAAERFFSTRPANIKIEEAAVLVGMLKANTAYNPIRNPQGSRERRNVVFNQMVKNDKLDQVVADSLSQLPIVIKYHVESHNEGLATYFRETLRLDLEQELKKYAHPDGRPYNLYTDGLKIYTTINSKMQQYAEEAVAEHMKDLQKTFISHFKGYAGAVPWGSDELLASQKKSSDRYRQLKENGLSEAEIDSNFLHPVRMSIFSWETESQEIDTLMSPLDSIKYYLSILNTGFLANDPQSGKILAWVGGINFKHFKFDHVKALRQVGSTFKPVVYAKALESGIQPCEQFPNEFRSYKEYGDWAPRNADGIYGGTYSMRGAMRMSVNSVAVHLIMKVGIDSVRLLARQLGISSNIPQEPGIALGSVDATLYEMMRMYSTFANQGVLPQLYYLTRIETPDGQAIAEFAPPNPDSFPRILQQGHANMLRYLLQSVVDGGTGGRLRYLTGFHYPAAGKTGTTNNNSDGWFIGFTPNIAVGAWVGAEQPLVRWQSTRLGQGGASALPICGKFLTKVYADADFKGWQKNNFPPLTGAAAGAFDCPDYIPDFETLLDSIAYYEALSPDSISEEQRRLHIDRIWEKLIESGYEEADSTRLDSLGVGEEGAHGLLFRKRARGDSISAAKRESERIRKKNERLLRRRERQEKRKEIVDKILGREG